MFFFFGDDSVLPAPDTVGFYHHKNARINSDMVACPLEDNARSDSQWTLSGIGNDLCNPIEQPKPCHAMPEI